VIKRSGPDAAVRPGSGSDGRRSRGGWDELGHPVDIEERGAKETPPRAINGAAIWAWGAHVSSTHEKPETARRGEIVEWVPMANARKESKKGAQGRETERTIKKTRGGIRGG